MRMAHYPIYCYRPGCGQLAVYKIAARWSDGITEELKTYALCCGDCLPEWFRRSCDKQKACRRARGEILERPGIYQLHRGQRDRQLQRLTELENQFAVPAERGASAPEQDAHDR
jgi:hypothetical protein